MSSTHSLHVGRQEIESFWTPLRWLSLCVCVAFPLAALPLFRPLFAVGGLTLLLSIFHQALALYPQNPPEGAILALIVAVFSLHIVLDLSPTWTTDPGYRLVPNHDLALSSSYCLRPQHGGAPRAMSLPQILLQEKSPVCSELVCSILS